MYCKIKHLNSVAFLWLSSTGLAWLSQRYSRWESGLGYPSTGTIISIHLTTSDIFNMGRNLRLLTSSSTGHTPHSQTSSGQKQHSGGTKKSKNSTRKRWSLMAFGSWVSRSRKCNKGTFIPDVLFTLIIWTLPFHAGHEWTCQFCPRHSWWEMSWWSKTREPTIYAT